MNPVGANVSMLGATAAAVRVATPVENEMMELKAELKELKDKNTKLEEELKDPNLDKDDKAFKQKQYVGNDSKIAALNNRIAAELQAETQRRSSEERRRAEAAAVAALEQDVLETKFNTLVISPDKRKFTTNGSIDKTARAQHFFVDTTATNAALYEKIRAGNYIMVHGPRAVGKSTRMLQACDDLRGEFICMNVSLHDVLTKTHVPTESAVIFKCSTQQVRELWTNNTKLPRARRVVLVIDEFDVLGADAGEDVLNDVLSRFRGLKQDRAAHLLHSVVVVGVFSLVRFNTRKGSPFNVGEQFKAPLMSLLDVQDMFKKFLECRPGFIVEDAVVEDIFERTGGHAGLVNLCGKAIDEEIRGGLSEPSLSLPVWLSRLRARLQTWLMDFPTMKRLVDDMCKGDDLQKACRVVLSQRFLCRSDAVPSDLVQDPVCDFLMSVGVVREVAPGKLCIANSMIRMLAVWRMVPVDRRLTVAHVLPMQDGKIDMLQLLLCSTFYFPAADVLGACEWSFKNSGRGRNGPPVPHEYFYQSQLASVLRMWLPESWRFFPEVKTTGDRRRIDFVLESGAGLSGSRCVLELEATSSDRELREHYGRAAEYGRMIKADHVWVVHFCAVALDACRLPVPANGSKIHVLHLMHSATRNGVSWSALYCAPGSDKTVRISVPDATSVVAENKE